MDWLSQFFKDYIELTERQLLFEYWYVWIPLALILILTAAFIDRRKK